MFYSNGTYQLYVSYWAEHRAEREEKIVCLVFFFLCERAVALIEERTGLRATFCIRHIVYVWFNNPPFSHFTRWKFVFISVNYALKYEY